MSFDQIKVAVRVRKPLKRELGASTYWKTNDNGGPINKEIWSVDGGKKYTFDRVFAPDEGNDIVYEEIGRENIESAMNGFNTTIFAYGQTGSGKTYTMLGDPTNPGLIQSAIDHIFELIPMFCEKEFLLRVSYLEIYNENVTDLLALEQDRKKNLQVKDDIQGNVTVEELQEIAILDKEAIFKLMEQGEKNRHFGSTNMNERSSRSHTIFRIIIESAMADQDADGGIMVSHLNLVDLAGSERASQTGAVGERFREGVNINKSLMVLGQVISKLSEGHNDHIPFRDSKLTRILKNSLGGNARTSIISTVTLTEPVQTKSTLDFASRAKTITQHAKVNEILDDRALMKRMKKQIEEYESELQRLRIGQSRPADDELSVQLAETRQLIARKEDEITKLKTQFLKNLDINMFETLPIKNKGAMNRRKTWCSQASTKSRLSLGSHYSFRPFQAHSTDEVSEDRNMSKPVKPAFDFDLTSSNNTIEFDFDESMMNSVFETIPEEDLDPGFDLLDSNSVSKHCYVSDRRSREKKGERKKVHFDSHPSVISRARSPINNRCKRLLEVPENEESFSGTPKIVLRQRLDAKDATIQKLSQDFKELEEFTRLESDIHSGQTNEELLQEVTAKDQNIQKLVKELAQVKKENNVLKTSLEKATEAEQDKAKKVVFFQTEMDKLWLEKSELERRCRKADENLASAQEQTTIIRSSLIQLTQELTSKDDECSRLKEDLKNVSIRLETSSCSNCDDKLSKSRTSLERIPENENDFNSDDVKVLTEKLQEADKRIKSDSEIIEHQNLQIAEKDLLVRELVSKKNVMNETPMVECNKCAETDLVVGRLTKEKEDLENKLIEAEEKLIEHEEKLLNMEEKLIKIEDNSQLIRPDLIKSENPEEKGDVTTAQLNAVQNQLEKCKVKLIEKESHILDLSSKLEKAILEVKQKDEHCIDLREKLGRAEQLLNRGKNSVENIKENETLSPELNLKLEEASQTIKQQEDHTADLEQKLEVAEIQLNESKALIEKLENEIQAQNNEKLQIAELQLNLDEAILKLNQQEEENINLRVKLEEGELALYNTSALINNLESKIEEQNTQEESRTALHSKLEDAQETVDDLKSKLQAAEKQVTENTVLAKNLEGKLSEHLKEKDTICSQLEATTAKLNKKENDFTNVRLELENVQLELETQKSQIEKQVKTIKEQENTIEQLETKLECAVSTITPEDEEHIKIQLVSAEQKLSSVSTLLDTLKVSYIKKVSDHDLLVGNLNKLKSELEMEQSTRQNLKEKLDSAERENNSNIVKMNNSQEAMDELKKQYALLQQDYTRSTTEHGELKCKLEEAQMNSQTVSNRFEAEKTALETTNQGLTAKLTQALEDQSQAASECEELRFKLEEAGQHLLTVADGFDLEKANLEADIHTLETKLSQAIADLTQATGECDDLRCKLEETQKHLVSVADGFEAEKSNLESENKALVDKLSEISDNLQAKDLLWQELREKFKEKSGETDQNSDLIKQLEETQDMSKKLSLALESLQSEMSSKDLEFSKLLSNYSEIEAELLDKKQMVSELDKVYQEAKSTIEVHAVLVESLKSDVEKQGHDLEAARDEIHLKSILILELEKSLEESKTELSSSLSSVSKLTSLLEEFRTAKEELDIRSNEAETLKEQLSAQTELIFILEQAVKEADKRHESDCDLIELLKNDLQEQVGIQSTFKEQLHNHENKIASLEKSILAAQQEKEDFGMVMASLRTSIKNLESAKTDLENQLSSQSSDNAIEMLLHESRKQQKLDAAQIDSLQREMDSLRQKERELESQISAKSMMIAELQQATSKLETFHSSDVGKAKSLQIELNAERSQVYNLQEKLESQTETLRVLEDSLKEAKKRHEFDSQLLETYKANLKKEQSAKGDYERQLAEQADEIFSLQQTLAETQKKNSTDSTLVQALKSDLEKETKLRKSFQEKLTDQEAGMYTIEQAFQEAKERHREDSELIETLQQEISLKEELCKSLSCKVENYETVLKSRKEKVQELEAKLEESYEKMNADQILISSLEEKLESVSTTVEDVTANSDELEKIMSERDEAQAKVEDLKKMMDEISSQKDAESTKIVRSLQREIAEKKVEIAALNVKFTRLEDEKEINEKSLRTALDNERGFVRRLKDDLRRQQQQQQQQQPKSAEMSFAGHEQAKTDDRKPLHDLQLNEQNPLSKGKITKEEYMSKVMERYEKTTWGYGSGAVKENLLELVKSRLTKVEGERDKLLRQQELKEEEVAFYLKNSHKWKTTFMKLKGFTDDCSNCKEIGNTVLEDSKQYKVKQEAAKQ